MKRYLATALILVIVVSLADAQSRRRRKADGPEFAERVWFGVNVNDLRFGNSTFTFGLTPMAALEVIDDLSVGIMFKADYYYQKLLYSAPRIKFESIDFGPGIFARVDILQQYFAQLEFEHAFLERPQTDNAGNWIIDQARNVVLTERIEQNYAYIGAGYASGANVQYSISIHYNILDDFDSERFPWDYRFGIKWYLR